ncbi:hypothetical protein AU106_gp145 [Sinorhizobium phage phiM9]|uniref:Uncharacterized protein n=1 Tax=Sinorhizobium phage phiM9 TaxID=1636182 RepID=A0A0F6TGT2_9CAUD|nr:hypothetical protein AU106_gp145 [Sinorhizobium phage phiM9]AKE44776.1 hypothetical protein Sm_phiM9_148 [Sinorhizobium phage phiM9]
MSRSSMTSPLFSSSRESLPVRTLAHGRSTLRTTSDRSISSRSTARFVRTLATNSSPMENSFSSKRSPSRTSSRSTKVQSSLFTRTEQIVPTRKFAMKPMKSYHDVQAAIGATKDLEDAKKRLLEKPSGYHPSDLLVAVQKKQRDRDSLVNELRSSFHVIQGGKKD